MKVEVINKFVEKFGKKFDINKDFRKLNEFHKLGLYEL